MEESQYELCASVLRRHSDKAGRDREQAAAVMRALQAAGQTDRLRSVFARLPPKWRAQIARAIELSGEPIGARVL